MKQLPLNLNYESSDDALVQKMATEAVEDGDFSSWDDAYESIWEWYEEELKIGEEYD